MVVRKRFAVETALGEAFEVVSSPFDLVVQWHSLASIVEVVEALMAGTKLAFVAPRMPQAQAQLANSI